VLPLHSNVVRMPEAAIVAVDQGEDITMNTPGPYASERNRDWNKS
jgi:hypothetical protein